MKKYKFSLLATALLSIGLIGCRSGDSGESTIISTNSATSVNNNGSSGVSSGDSVISQEITTSAGSSNDATSNNSSANSSGTNISTGSSTGSSLESIEIIFSESSVSIERGLTFLNQYQLSPVGTSHQLSWTSSNTGVATVNSEGVVNAVDLGVATITAKSQINLNVTSSYAVSVVREQSLLQSFTIAGEEVVELDLDVNKIIQLSVNVSPNNTRSDTIWNVTEGDAVSVTSLGLVTALKTGMAIVQACPRFKTPFDCPEVLFNVSDLYAPISIAINAAEKDIIEVGELLQLSAYILPAEANQEMIWYSLDPDVAVVDYDGLVRGVSVGEAYIAVEAKRDSEIYDLIEINVIDAAVEAPTLVKLQHGNGTLSENYASNSELSFASGALELDTNKVAQNTAYGAVIFGTGGYLQTYEAVKILSIKIVNHAMFDFDFKLTAGTSLDSLVEIHYDEFDEEGGGRIYYFAGNLQHFKLESTSVSNARYLKSIEFEFYK